MTEKAMISDAFKEVSRDELILKKKSLEEQLIRSNEANIKRVLKLGIDIIEDQIKAN